MFTNVYSKSKNRCKVEQRSRTVVYRPDLPSCLFIVEPAVQCSDNDNDKQPIFGPIVFDYALQH
jgi:hypothetical protein